MFLLVRTLILISWIDGQPASSYKHHIPKLINASKVQARNLNLVTYAPKISNDLKKLDFNIPFIVSPLAYVSKYASISQGTIVMHNALVNAGASVGENCTINTNAVIEHDAIIGDHCHISTGAIINGGVFVSDECFIGSLATTKQSVKIPEKSFIKAGSVVK